MRSNLQYNTNLKQGFTLLEVIIAMLISGILLGTVLMNMSQGSRLLAKGQEFIRVSETLDYLIYNALLKKEIKEEVQEGSFSEYGLRYVQRVSQLKKEIIIDGKSFTVETSDIYDVKTDIYSGSKTYNSEIYLTK